MKNFLLLLTLIIFSGCATQVNYTPPETSTDSDISIIINNDYDTTWSALIDHVSSTFFAIDNFEKESGLITADFSASDPNNFIDCGYHSASWIGEGYQKQEFEGSYIDFLSTYFESDFTGRINITTRRLSDYETEVRVNARYILSSGKDMWSFDSGSESSIDVSTTTQEPRIRTCKPTYTAEKSILDAVKSITM